MGMLRNTRSTLPNLVPITNSPVRPQKALELGKQVSLGADPRAGFDLFLLKRSNIDWMIHQWNFEWDQYDEALRTKCFIKTLEPTQICKDWNHQTAAKVIQLITGHGPFRHHVRHWRPPEWDTRLLTLP